MEYDKFIEMHHGQHSAHIVRRADRGEDEMSSFVVDMPTEDVNLLAFGLAKIVNDPKKLELLVEDVSDEEKERACELAMALIELLTRRYESRHNHVWHCIISDPETNNSTTDTGAVLIATAYAGECADGAISEDGDDPPNEPSAPRPMLPPGTIIIDT